MGKAQSKRSVDITTEPSKEIQEGSGELKKLDDAYFKENESSVSIATQCNVLQLISTTVILIFLLRNLFQDKENKVANDAAENEKNESVKAEDTIAVEAAAPGTDENKIEAPSTAEKASEEINEATPEPDSASKPKKDKMKKKWSFRSISFGKKDKQKPSKKDKKNEENKAVAEGVEVGEEGAETKSVNEKPEESKTEAVETRPLEPVVETAIAEFKEETKAEKNIKLEAAPVSEPVQAVVEAVKEKTPEPEPVVVAQPQEIRVEEPIVEEAKAAEESIPVIEIEAPPSPVEEKPEEVPEKVSDPIVEEPPAVPTTSPPSQFSMFAETMNTQTIEENLPAAAEIVEVEVEAVNGQAEEDDVKPVAEFIVEQVLEEAVDKVESEIAEREEEELPPPPTDEVESQQAPEVVVEVTQNGVGEHIDEPTETVKV